MKPSLKTLLDKNQIDSAARAATEELAPTLDGKRVFISVDRSGRVIHRDPRPVETSVSRMLSHASKSAKPNGKSKPGKSPRQRSKRSLKQALAHAVRLIAGTD